MQTVLGRGLRHCCLYFTFHAFNFIPVSDSNFTNLLFSVTQHRSLTKHLYVHETRVNDMYFPFMTSRSSRLRKRELSPRAGGGGGGRGGGGGGGGRSGGSSGSSGGSSGGGRSGGSSGSSGGSSGGGRSGGSSGSSGGSSGGGISGGSSGSSGGSSGGGRSGGSSGSSGGGSGGGRSSPISTGGTPRSATPFGAGGGPVTKIPSGQLFSGRDVGGGTRSQVYGTSQYGSGYPGIAGRGVANRGFPFFFWPLAWGGLGVGGAAYLHNNEYGSPDNSSRPGGRMMTATFASSTSNTTFHLVADDETVVDLIEDVRNGCSSRNLAADKSSTSPSSYNDTDPSSPKPESAIQYYRASSVALTLDGYNNSAALSGTEGQPDTPLPSNIDTTLKDCLNQTIGDAVPLIGGADVRWAAPNIGMLALIWVFLHLTTTV
ncbi:hypothetical protein E1B28_001610 [Marasmius oreades]|uniref:Uncharacterized protein n=1 Tax=Marasmius oreades TaxID=181124 RepID=A0A9P7V3W9_9AGAR|nr:uncharacterized protein E1B28_001610 [Marasmius oreades]KAG7099798.1 hypothetical protein E1B28_001610 [Marasmius oreades]